MWVFSTPLVNQRPSLVNPPPPPKKKVKVHRQCVAGRGWGGMLSCVKDHILQKFSTMFLARFRTSKIVFPPRTKTQEGRGPQTGKHLPQSPFTGQLFQMTTFGIAVYQSYLSTIRLIPDFPRPNVSNGIVDSRQNILRSYALLQKSDSSIFCKRSKGLFTTVDLQFDQEGNI